MTNEIYGWMVMRKDGTPAHNVKSNAIAVFEHQADARNVSGSIKASSVVPCTIAY
jgi:hypothetical protein